MKKMISVLAMTLLVIGAAQAQDVTKRMVVQLKNGQVVKYNTENIEDVTFEIIDLSDLPDVPTTIEEAKAILYDSYWKIDDPDYVSDLFEDIYIVITEDLKALWCLKVKDSVTDEDLAPYAGKYVVAIDLGEVSFPSEEDPTTFSLSDWLTGTNLQLYSFDLTNDDGVDTVITTPCVRVEPFEYIGGDYLFKGKPAL